MKLAGARIQAFVTAFLAKPDPKWRAILVYGPDQGLVRERAEALAKAAVPALDDPFSVAMVPGATLASDPARLNDEMAAQSLAGGRRLLRVRDAGDALAETCEELLEEPPAGDSLCIMEAGDLATRSALRRVFERASNAAAVPCYVDGARELGDLMRSVLGSHRLVASAEAQEYLTDHLGADRGVSRAELEKLALYAGDGRRIELEDALAAVGDSAALTAEDAAFAAAEGNTERLERALSRAFEEGENAVAILRGAMRHFERLQLTGLRIAAGSSAEEAMRVLRPQIFFKNQESFSAGLRRWPPRRAAVALRLLLEAEQNTKRTGFPDRTVCSECLLRLARGGQAQAS
ncbi:MAG TPA: DNA polymerase III subunit delta [Stellaceae bacterium]|nr:DNA polymerase III subunit delta [Stellaceae bacterium]